MVKSFRNKLNTVSQSSLYLTQDKFVSTLCHVQVPESRRRKGHVDRLRAEEKWQSRARLTETSFGFLEAQMTDPSTQLPLLPQKKKALEDWHFEKPLVRVYIPSNQVAI